MSRAFKPIEPSSLNLNELTSHNLQHNQYVFVDGNNLGARWQSFSAQGNPVFSIGETQFGSGLNFLLTWRLWECNAPRSASLHFIACEQHPLTLNYLTEVFAHWPELACYSEALLKQYPQLTPGTHHLFFAQGRIKLTLMLGECYEQFEQLLTCGDSLMEHYLRPIGVDAWYLNSSKWSLALAEALRMLSHKQTTYASMDDSATLSGYLNQCGFSVVKKKTLCEQNYIIGCVQSITHHQIKNRVTPWHSAAQTPSLQRKALVVGAGLAGCFIAYALAQRGWDITLVDEHAHVGQGASGNQRAVLFPKLSAFSSPFTEFMLAAFLYAHRMYSSLLECNSFGSLNGALSLPFNAKEQHAQDGLSEWLAAYPALGQLVNAQEASVLAGIPIQNTGLFIPYSGWIDSPALCDFLIQHKNISLISNTRVGALDYDDNQWWIANKSAATLILANGFEVNQFTQTKHLPVRPIRGQMTSIQSDKYTQLKIPVCAEGHIVPYITGEYYIGASYDLITSTNCIKAEDDQLNLKKLNDISALNHSSPHILSSWAGVRASTPDYLPLVGGVAQADAFLSVYADLERNAKLWIPKAAPMHPGLYAFAGFGSRGLTTIPLAAEWLAALLNNEVVAAPRNLMQSLSPARFLRRSIIRGLA